MPVLCLFWLLGQVRGYGNSAWKRGWSCCHWGFGSRSSSKSFIIGPWHCSKCSWKKYQKVFERKGKWLLKDWILLCTILKSNTKWIKQGAYYLDTKIILNTYNIYRYKISFCEIEMATYYFIHIFWIQNYRIPSNTFL